MRSHSEDALVLGSALGKLRADPLEIWTSASDEQERVLKEAGRGEILFGGGNKSSKTSIAAMFVALARGKEVLGGVQLPSVPQPSQWVVSSLDFTQQLLSVQTKYLAAVGDWPHKVRMEGDTLKSLRIKYEGCRSDDPRDWSLITFVSAKNLQAGVGFRGNGYHCDEPPPLWLLSELRKMGDAGSIVIGVITATFLKRSQWQPLRLDYPNPAQNEGKWVGRFLRLRAPAFNPDDLDDTKMGNRFLTRADKEDLLAKYANLPESERLARILGLEMDTSGSNPLRAVLAEIQRQFEKARHGEWKDWRVSREVAQPGGKELVTETVEVESWEDDPVSGHIYEIFLDTSLGIADGQHDPGQAQVIDMTMGAQVERYEGFIGEYGLGVLGGSMSKKWGGARVWVGTTGGYGDTCLSGLRAVGCRNVATRQVTSRTGVIERTDLGFKETDGTRTTAFGALRELFVACAAGRPWFTIRSPDDLAQMLDVQVDAKGRIIRIPGVHHGESVLLLGKAASMCQPELRRPHIPERAQPIPESPVDVFRRDMGLPPRQQKAVPRMRRRFHYRKRVL
jgi:hypothetical protein